MGALPFMVVGVGGSAGSLEAFRAMVEALPADLGMAVIFMQHMAPALPSMLPELISARSTLPVELAAEGMPIRVNTIYVAPPDALLEVRGGVLHLSPLAAVSHSPPTRVDRLFSSMARDLGPGVIGVLLSGLGSDGTAGLREIKGAAGITMAQDPRSAQFDSMPRFAIQSDVADKVLAPRAIAAELIEIGRHPLAKQLHDHAEEGGAEPQPIENDLARIFSMLRHSSGVDFTYYKQPTIRRRLHRRMVLHKMKDMREYVKYLQDNPGEVSALYQDILIHVTRFFREPDSFQVLTSKVLPQIMENREAESPIRVWVPGCSTGEEPYSVAITLLEFLGDEAGSVPIQIFATDVSDAAVEQARLGVYPESITADVSPERLRRFFTKSDGNFRVAKLVRDCCIFARQDLTKDPPFSKLDLIMCRNVLIYLGPVLQKRLMNMFHYALKPTGFLMLGGAETVGPQIDLFTIADKRHKLYAKKLNAARTDIELPPVEPAAGRFTRRLAPEVRAGNSIQNEANRIILGKYSPPGVIVDNELRIVQFRGQTGLFLEPAPGEASLNLLKMAREGLLYGLRTAIHEARKGEAEVRKQALRAKLPGGTVDVDISVYPLGINAPEGRHFLVLFEKPAVDPDTLPAPAAKGKKKGARPERDDERVQSLQRELAASREYLQSIIQDLEAANEELQSANEEILSSNEELQSTNEELDTAKEELQSTNEELNTVNEELQGRNEELMHANSDLVNLLASVHIAIVMVAADLRVRRYTPMAEKVLNLIPTDIGRPISDIKPNIDCPDLEGLITEAIDSVTIKEREVQDRNGTWYSLRIRPYKNVENRIDGAVLALFDIDSSRRAPKGDAAGGVVGGAARAGTQERVGGDGQNAG
jgi:two-component system CheB/CheR fusion protein